MLSILEYSLDELKAILTKNGFEAYRAKQLFNFIYKKGIRDFSSMALPKALIAFLNASYTVLSLREASCQISTRRDTYKYALELDDNKKIESVLIRESGRNSLCISSQVGCPLACTFCATGTMGLSRSLRVDEIVSQFLFAKDRHDRIDNIVFMGMGEPFLNYKNLRKAICLLFEEEGLKFGARRITISTAGIARGIRKLANDEKLNKVNLAVSINSLDQHIRSSIMPLSRKIDLDELIRAIKYYKVKTNKRVTLEYVMLDKLNIGKEDAKKLIKLYNDDFKFNLNLIQYNPITILPTTDASYQNKHHKAPNSSSIQYFVNFFKYTDIEVVQRKRKGKDIKAACGQLVQAVS